MSDKRLRQESVNATAARVPLRAGAVLAVVLLAALAPGGCSSAGPGPADSGEPAGDGPADGAAVADDGNDTGDTGDGVASDDAGADAGEDGADAGADPAGDTGADAHADPGADAGGDGGADGAGDGGGDGGGDDGGGTTTRYCYQSCGQPGDCAQGWAPWDEDNYDCREGVCVYSGCNSDDECQSVPNMEDYLCRLVAPAEIPLCVKSCSQPGDCAQGWDPWDEDNYSCDDGVCVYTGCNSDDECQSVPSMEDYLCRPTAAGGADQCQPGCTTAADCDLGSAAYDADNYTCEGGLCVYSGCNSDDECQASSPSLPMVCHTPPP